MTYSDHGFGNTPKSELFGIELDNVSLAKAVCILTDWLSGERNICKYVVTPNINHVVLFQRNKEFRAAYEEASLVLADGHYIVQASRLLGMSVPDQVNGSDLVPAIFDNMAKRGRIRVFLLGAMPGVAQDAANRIRLRWPYAEVVGVYSPPMGFEHSAEEKRDMLRLVNEAEADLLILGISPPKQENWVSEFRQDLNVKVAICAGATIDFLAGEKMRAPKWMQSLGMEWIFRVLLEPRRLGPRYLADGIVFTRLLVRELRLRTSA